MTTILLLGIAAFALSAGLTPLVRRLALRVGLVDEPDRERKIHGRRVPLGGGLAVFASAAIALTLLALTPNPLQAVVLEHGRQLLGLAIASLVLVVVGLVDDHKGLRGRQKLVGQVAAVGILMYAGLMIRNVRFLDWELELGILSVPFTLFWLLGAINALNLIDGADGLASTVGAIITITIAALAMTLGHVYDAAVAVAVAGAILGFLVYNFPPASIFLGDTGSMLIGLVAGTCAINSSLKGPATVALAAPVAVLAIPIIDSTLAILRRRLTGRSIYCPDRGHLHHCLQRHGFGGRTLLASVSLLCGLTAAGALLSVYAKNEVIAVASVLAVIGILLSTGIFGHAEILLLANRAAALGASLATKPGHARGTVRKTSVQLQGTRDWEQVWDMLTEAAESLTIKSLRLNLNMPWLHEAYHASWECDADREAADLWRVDIPLMVDQRVVGRLQIAGRASDGLVGLRMTRFAAMLESVEDRLRLLAEHEPMLEPSHAIEPAETVLPSHSFASRERLVAAKVTS